MLSVVEASSPHPIITITIIIVLLITITMINSIIITMITITIIIFILLPGACALPRLSMALDRPVKRDMAMTGEVCSCEAPGLCFRSARSFAQVTLTGKVLRVGGIKEMLGV